MYKRKLTEHVDNLYSAVIDRSQRLIVHPPHHWPPHMTLARLPDHDDHVGVEEDQETDWDQEEDDKWQLVHGIRLKNFKNLN